MAGQVERRCPNASGAGPFSGAGTGTGGAAGIARRGSTAPEAARGARLAARTARATSTGAAAGTETGSATGSPGSATGSLQTGTGNLPTGTGSPRKETGLPWNGTGSLGTEVRKDGVFINSLFPSPPTRLSCPGLLYHVCLSLLPRHACVKSASFALMP